MSCTDSIIEIAWNFVIKSSACLNTQNTLYVLTLVLKVKMKPSIGYYSCTYCVNVLTTSLLMIWVAFAEIMMVVTGTLGSQ